MKNIVFIFLCFNCCNLLSQQLTIDTIYETNLKYIDFINYDNFSCNNGLILGSDRRDYASFLLIDLSKEKLKTSVKKASLKINEKPTMYIDSNNIYIVENNLNKLAIYSFNADFKKINEKKLVLKSTLKGNNIIKNDTLFSFGAYNENPNSKDFKSGLNVINLKNNEEIVYEVQLDNIEQTHINPNRYIEIDHNFIYHINPYEYKLFKTDINSGSTNVVIIGNNNFKNSVVSENSSAIAKYPSNYLDYLQNNIKKYDRIWELYKLNNGFIIIIYSKPHIVNNKTTFRFFVDIWKEDDYGGIKFIENIDVISMVKSEEKFSKTSFKPLFFMHWSKYYIDKTNNKIYYFFINDISNNKNYSKFTIKEIISQNQNTNSKIKIAVFSFKDESN